MRVAVATTDGELAAARVLIQEYAASLDIDLGFQGFDEEIAHFPRGYSPPEGAVYVAWEGEEPAGVVALRRYRGSVCEMKRLYVRPKHRGKGLGRNLSEAVIAAARRLGYAKMWLDTLPTMDAAIGLYRALGFHDIPAYRFNPVAGAHYMELELAPP
ncbi:MAG TPA: GNAT family N-acetyltransferase [Thermoplasmata archaeon]|jgi:carbonic anhydrase|nr:GNAT family N-acetyltransferase [Thermoplasmata archaeon]